MITSSEDKQLSLGEDSRIHWQKDPTNPLTGPAIGHIEKGNDILKPNVNLNVPLEILGDEDPETVKTFVETWLHRYIENVLAPLFVLSDDNNISAQAKDIADKVYQALGIIPREDIQELANHLDETGRAALRKRRVRMGPLLVYLPELNKPVSVRLQALLWNLWYGLELPANVPKDGIVSFSVKDMDVEPRYYRAIGYPVYGPRAIRVDMLDRVVCAVYDNARDGKFQAQHKMAEWLGSNIADLYDVLEAMGHKKIHDPLDEKIKQETEHTEQEKTGHTDKEDEKLSDKPELATFRLKRGKASERSKPSNTPVNSKKTKKKKPKKNKGSGASQSRNIQAGPKPKPEDSPFAVLQQLKLSKDDS